MLRFMINGVKKMITKLKKPLLFVLALLPIAIIAGIFVGLYQLEIFSQEVINELTAQLGSTNIIILISVVQTIGYALFCGFIGYLLSNAVGLWKNFKINRKSLIVTLVVSVIGGIVFSLDYWVFGSLIDGVKASYWALLTVNATVASVVYGGVIEEVMLRLFFMSLLSFIIWKIFYKKCDKESIPTLVFVAANIIAAVLFAAGHLPATYMLFGKLTPIIIVRCFLLNGAFGLLFGWLYRKYGIVYSMLSHALLHIVSKVIWFVFIG